MSDAGSLEHAVERAAEARAAIASVVARVRSGEIDLPAALAEADQDLLIGRCFAVKVFEAVPGIGKVRARRTMAEVGLDEDVWLTDVTEPDRTAMIAAFREPAPSDR